MARRRRPSSSSRSPLRLPPAAPVVTVDPRPAQAQTAVRVELGVVNLLANGSFEVNTTGWLVFNATAARDTLRNVEPGIASLRVTSTVAGGAGAYAGAPLAGATAGLRRRVSLWVFGGAGSVGKEFALIAREEGGAAAAADSVELVELDDGWQHVVVEREIVEDDRTSLVVVAELHGAAIGDVFFIDRVEVTDLDDDPAAIVDAVDVYRVGPSGVRAYVRGAVGIDPAGGNVVDVRDYEVPFGVPVDYVAVARNAADVVNRVPNPSFEVDNTNWSTNATLDRVVLAESALFGVCYGRLQCNVAGPLTGTAAPGGDVGALRLGMLPERTYTFSVYVYVPAGAGVALADVRPVLYDRIGVGAYEEVAGPSPTAFDEWQRLVVAKTIRAGATEALARVTVTNFESGNAIRVDGAQLEEVDAANASEYLDGSMAGGTWEGTAHASNTLAVTERESAPVRVQVDVADDWLSDLDDARNSGPVMVESFAELAYNAPQGVHRPLGRRTPIVTSDIRWTPTGKLVLVTATDAEARRVRDAFGSSSPLLFRTPREHGVGSMYLVALGDVTEQRLSRLAHEPGRRWTATVVELDRPDPSTFVPAVVTYADVLATFDSYAEVLAARADYGELLYSFDGMPEEGLFSREPAFPPRDV